MKITDVSIKRPMLVTVVIIIVLLLGMVSFSRLSIDLFPDLELPVAAVITSYPGVGPEEIEQQITKPMESVLSTVNNLDTIYSISGMGSSMVMVMFDWGTDMSFAALDMREQIDLIRSALPSEAEAPLVFKADVNMMPILQVAAFSDDPASLKQTVDDLIQPRLERVGGVASVWYMGGWQREIQVQVDPVKLNGYGLSLNTITGALGRENMTASAGTVHEGRSELLLRVTGEFENLDQVRQVVVGQAGDFTVHLGDVAQVTDGQKKETQISRVNGQPGMSLMIQKQSDANTVETAQKVKAALKDLEKEVPGVKFEMVMDQSEIIEKSINSMINSAMLGGLLAVLFIWVFLRNVRSTFIISTSIPIAIIGAFVLLYLNNMTLNVITLGGLALGIALIVDDSIVVLENIYRHIGLGMDPMTASRQATDEVGSAVIASTLTIAVVFLPIIFVKGMAAQIFTPMALSITFCVLASLAVAITLVPLLASRWFRKQEPTKGHGTEQEPGGLEAGAEPNGETGSQLEPKPGDQGKRRIWQRVYDTSERWFNALDNRYRWLLELALGRRKRTLLVTGVIFILSLFAIPLVGMEFMPGMDQGYVTISVEMPKGTALKETDRAVTEIEKVLVDIPGIQNISSDVGSSGSMGMGSGSSDMASIIVKLVEMDQRDYTADELVTQLGEKLQRIPGAEIKVSAMESGMGMGGAPVEVKISGDDLDVLTQLGDEIAQVIENVPGTREVASSLEEGRPELNVLINRNRAAQYGLGTAEIASTVRASIDGAVATRYRVAGDEVDVRVQLQGSGEYTPASLAGLTITTPFGTTVPLDQLAELEEKEGPVSISRENQSRVVSVTAQLDGRDLGSVVKDIQAELDHIPMPSGYIVDFGGEQEQMMETFGDLALALVLAIILVYLVMVAQFESLLHPFVIMFSMPITLTGVIFGLLVTGRTFSVPAFIGLIMLAGIVVKNAIVLVDYINKLRQRGLERNEAILQAGPIRLRPILMTAITTIMAMMPMTIGIGEGSESQAPLATAVVFGLAFSTLITLVVVPVIYTILDDLVVRFRRRRNKTSDRSTAVTMD